ncbi:MAG: DUF1800 family protein [Betaproteobacteria bacterium]
MATPRLTQGGAGTRSEGLRQVLRLLAVLMLMVWAAAATAATLGPDNARHLLNRAGFGASLAEVETYARLTRAQATERLLAVKGGVLPEPDWVREPYFPPGRLASLDAETRTRVVAERIDRGIQLREWWLRQMLVTPDPLRERMTLFWHNHFVSGLQKVLSPQLMYRQNVLLREQALGNFGTLLHAVARDPAMLRYLDSAFNRKGSPNENFARELMELFTLGEGHYTEQDVKEVARAFTGWSLSPEGEFVFRPALHDDGPKTVLGRQGNFGGSEVLDLLLERPETATLIARKLWLEFVSPQPVPAEVARIAAALRGSGYDIRAALRVLFNSEAFYAPANRGVLVKSPVDLVVGTLRQFEFEVPDVLPFVFAAGQFGQVLFAPPNVKGWPGGELWINATTLLQRKQLLDTLFQDRLAVGMAGMGMMAVAANVAANPAAARQARARLALGQVRFDADAWLVKLKGTPPARAVLAVAPVHAVTGAQPGLEDLRALVLDPASQLK